MVSLSSFFPFLFLLEKKFTLLQDQLETLETSLPQPSPQWDYRVIHYTVNNFFLYIRFSSRTILDYSFTSISGAESIFLVGLFLGSQLSAF